MLDALHVAWYASLTAETVLLWRLFHLGLPLPWFKGYLAASLLQSAFFLIVAPRPNARAYDVVWIGSEPAMLLLVSFVSVEACRRIRESFPGIGRFGQWAIAVLSLLAALLCLASIGPDLHAADWHRPVLTWGILAKRVVSTIISLMLIAILGCVAVMRSRVPRNVLMHARLLSIFLAIPAVGVGLVALRIGSSRSASIGILFAITLCFAGWSLLLRRDGEDRPAPSRVVSNADLNTSGNRVRALVEALESALR
jgi:hypothetical protein